jgi:hypothetical protein
MEVPAHLVQLQPDGQLEPVALEDGVDGGDGLLADLADLLLYVLLVELDDGG